MSTSSPPSGFLRCAVAAALDGLQQQSAEMRGAGALGSVPGVIHMAAQRMFEQMAAAREREFLVRVSYLEIYNENLRDLLADGDAPAAAAIREDPRRGVDVELGAAEERHLGDVRLELEELDLRAPEDHPLGPAGDELVDHLDEEGPSAVGEDAEPQLLHDVLEDSS